MGEDRTRFAATEDEATRTATISVASGGGWSADTSVRRYGCAPADLLTAIRQVGERWPTARLVRNQVGNLSVVVDGEDVGFVDLTAGRLEEYDRPQP